MSTFVLVPGAGGSVWVWSRVARLLVGGGHDVTAVDLAGDDDTAGLARYTELAVDLQRRVDRDRLGVEVDVLPGGHLLPLVQPQQVADYLLRATRPDGGA